MKVELILLFFVLTDGPKKGNLSMVKFQAKDFIEKALFPGNGISSFCFQGNCYTKLFKMWM
jgi:hypothetical protein